MIQCFYRLTPMSKPVSRKLVMLFLLFLLTQETHKQIKPIAHLNHTDHPKLNPNTLVEPSQVLSARKPVSRLLLKHILILLEFWNFVGKVDHACAEGRIFHSHQEYFTWCHYKNFGQRQKREEGVKSIPEGGVYFSSKEWAADFSHERGMPPSPLVHLWLVSYQSVLF